MAYTHTRADENHTLAVIELEDPSGEMLTDGGLELWTGNDLNEWTETESGSSVVEDETGDVHGGSHSAKITIDADSNNAQIYQFLSYVEGNCYKVVFWAKGSTTNVILVRDHSSGDLYEKITLTTNWKRYNFIFTANSNSAYIQFRRGELEPSWHFFLDDISLYEIKTLRYAETTLSMSDGFVYEGRLELSRLTKAFSSYEEPKPRLPSLTLTLCDLDYTIRQLLTDYHWGSRKVTVYIGKGTDILDYDIDFVGIIKQPRGISYDIHNVFIKLRDVRCADVTLIPPNKFWKSNYADLDMKFSGTSIPIIYGDFSDMQVPAVCIDTSTGPKMFKIADHAINEITQVYKNGAPASHGNEDLANATFTLASFDPDLDIVTVEMKGIEDGGVLVTHPIDILQHMQENYIGIDIDDIDTASYTAVKGDWSTSIKGRKCLNQALSSNTVVAQLCFELAVDLIIVANTYTLKSRAPSTVTDKEFDNTNVVEYSYKVEFDPDNLYRNRSKNHYCFNPSTGLYEKTYRIDDTVEQAKAGQIISNTLNYEWMYEQVDTENLAERQALTYSREIRVVSFTGLGDAITLELADRILFTLANLVARPLMVREVIKNFTRKLATIRSFDIISFLRPGYWMSDDAPNYADSSAEERAVSGYWTNDDGEASPGDSASKISKWW